jgi:hypothetical protein
MCQCDEEPHCRGIRSAFSELVNVSQTLNTVDHSLTLTASRALGLLNQCGEGVHVDPPPANQGFYREDAQLVVFFLTHAGSGEDPLGENPVVYNETLRQLRSLKGRGREGDVVAVSITPVSAASASAAVGASILPSDFCQRLSTTAAEICQSSRFVQDARIAQLAAPQTCGDLDNPQPDRGLISLACDTRGVIYNMCAEDWSSVITESLRERLVGDVLRVRLHQHVQEGQDILETCGQNGLCATLATEDGHTVPVLAANIALETAADGTSELVINQPVTAGSTLQVRYNVAESEDTQCCNEDSQCAEEEICNQGGFCQSNSCAGRLGCPSNSAVCDVPRQTCVPNSSCTVNEHCPFGYVCDCAGGNVCRLASDTSDCG